MGNLINIHGKKFFSVYMEDANSASPKSATPSGGRVFITDIIVSSDLVGAEAILRDTTSGTLLAIELGTPQAFSHQFASPIVGTANEAVWIEVNGTSVARATICGFIA